MTKKKLIPVLTWTLAQIDHTEKAQLANGLIITYIRQLRIKMKHFFKARIYKVGINWGVDVPTEITDKLIANKGYIKIKGQINNFDFNKSLVPVKNSPYRLFVNLIMMKGAKTSLGRVADFIIEQDLNTTTIEYSVPKSLVDELEKCNLTEAFNGLTPSRRKDILKYLNYIKTEETLEKNISKLVEQLKSKSKDIRIP